MVNIGAYTNLEKSGDLDFTDKHYDQYSVAFLKLGAEHVWMY